jgi:ligand-binding sensor domain-containing protein
VSRIRVLAVVLALTAAGCSTGGGETTTTATPSASTAAATTALPDAAASSTPTTVGGTATTEGPAAEQPTAWRIAARDAELSCDDARDLGAAYAEAVAYWIAIGRPARMDADGNGLPCESVFPAQEVDAFYHPADLDRTSGRFCRDLSAAGVPLQEAIAYWLLEGAPARMDADGNGIPCETVYPPEDFAALFPLVSNWRSFTNANQIVDVDVAPDGTVWAVGYGGAVHWDPETGGYEKYVVEDGLASNAVNAVDVAADGTVWLATMSGASSFDGATWDTSLEGEYLLSVLAGSDGRVWLGGNDQAFVVGPDGATRFDHVDGIYYGVMALAEAPNGTMYAYTSGCDGEGCQHDTDYPDIIRLDGGRWESVATQDFDGWTMRMQLQMGNGDLMFDPAGVLWATELDDGLLTYDGTTWTEHDAHAAGMPADWFRTATIDASGTIWGAYRDVIVRFDGTAATGLTLPSDGSASVEISSLAIDPGTGRLWVATYDGLAGSGRESWAWYRTADRLPSNGVWALATEGADLWIGTTEGIGRRRGDEWTTFTAETLIDGVAVSSVAIAPDGTIWAGNWNSISWFDGASWHAEGGRDGAAPHEGDGLYGAPLAVGPDGAVWAVARGAGDLVAYRDGAWDRLPAPESCQPSNLAVDGAGTLWVIGGCSSVCSYDGSDWTVHLEGTCWDPVWDPEPEVAYPGLVQALSIDRAGAAVISTDQGGLLRWDGASWASIGGSGSGPESAAGIAFGPDGSVWALEGKDLYVLADGTWTSIAAAPFTTSYMSAVTVDDAGAVWIATEAGVIRYRGSG